MLKNKPKIEMEFYLKFEMLVLQNFLYHDHAIIKPVFVYLLLTISENFMSYIKMQTKEFSCVKSHGQRCKFWHAFLNNIEDTGLFTMH